METNTVPKQELDQRMTRFIAAMTQAYPNWELSVIIGGMNLFYFTGTVGDGALVIQRGETPVLWMRRSYERSVLESEFADIRPMTSYREVAASLGSVPEVGYLDMAEASLEWYGVFNKHLQFKQVLPLDNVVLQVRAIKSSYEIEIMSKAGKTIDTLMRGEIPSRLREGMSEAEWGTDIFSLFIENGHQGLNQFSMRNADVLLGHIGFGESPLYPSVFNGASGTKGLCPAMPVMGSRDVLLKKGDLVYLDPGFGAEGYNVDKTLIYSYGGSPSAAAKAAHEHCLEIAAMAVSMLKEGELPSAIYEAALKMVRPEYADSFMGVPGRTVPFLGHGVGLFINEWPVLAKGFDQPLQCGMTMAIEPKIGIPGVGMVGTENTYVITKEGAVSLSGEMQDILLV